MQMSDSGKVSSALPAKPTQAQTRINKIYPDLSTDDDHVLASTNSNSRNQKNGSLKSSEKTKIMMKKAKQDSCHTCENIPDDGCITKLPCYQKLHESFCFKVFVFLLVFCLDAVDLVSDWLLYHDVATTEQGLVYGPPEDVLVWLLLAFSIVGSLTFSFEVVNLWWEIFRNNPWIDSDLMSAITTWIEDVPQIVINVMIVACREEAISYFQLVKAAIIIAGAIIRITVTLIKYCSKRALCELHNAGKNAKYRHHVIYRVIIMLGLFVTLAGSVTIFLFTQSERNPDGTLNFKVPHSVIIGEYDDEKYFHNVSIFFRHPLFNQNNVAAAGGVSQDKLNWIRMATIYDIREKYENLQFKVKYDNTTKQNIVLSLENSTGNAMTQDCFHFDRTTGAITLQPCSNSLTNMVEFIFKFHYRTPETPNLIFGDIKYNVKVKENGQCHDPSSKVYDKIADLIGDINNAGLHYFRTKPNVSEEKHLLVDAGGTTAKFYQAANLTDISEVWRTGFATCKSTGSLAPHEDSSITVPCT